MGCDVHLHVEVRRRKSKEDDKEYPWFTSGFSGQFSERNYSMFAVMADVRNYEEVERIIPERDFPDDACWSAVDKYYYTITDNRNFIDWSESNYCSKEDAEKWLQRGYSKYHPTDKTRITGPDWHSPGWCTYDELQKCIEAVENKEMRSIDADWYALAAYMKAYEERGYECRAVYWFDN